MSEEAGENTSTLTSFTVTPRRPRSERTTTSRHSISFHVFPFSPASAVVCESEICPPRHFCTPIHSTAPLPLFPLLLHALLFPIFFICHYQLQALGVVTAEAYRCVEIGDKVRWSRACVVIHGYRAHYLKEEVG